MQINMYTLFDSAAKAYLTPFFLTEDGLAIRTFSDNVNTENESNLSKHPDQFTLFKLGTYDDTNSKLDLLPSPLSLANGLELKHDPLITKSQYDELLKRISNMETK